MTKQLRLFFHTAGKFIRKDLREHAIPWIFLIAIISSLLYCSRGLFHPESDYFYQNWLDNRPIWVKLFDAERGRWFQARELSYVFDYIDAHFILLSAALGHVHFYSLTHYVSIFFIAALSYLISRKFFGQKYPILAALVSFLYLTSPGPFFTVPFYRSSKILVSFFLVIIIYQLLRVVKNSKITWSDWMFLLVSSFGMALSDKEGALYGYILVGAAGVMWVFFRTRYTFFPILSFFASSLLYELYSFWIGPWLVKHVGGVKTEFLPDSSYFNYIQVIPVYLRTACEYMLYQFSYILGNLELTVITAIVLVVWAYLFVRLFSKSTQAVKAAIILVSLLLVGSLPILTFMLHYSILFFRWEDIRMTYYNLPIAALTLLSLQLVVAQSSLFLRSFRREYVGVLLFVLFLNVVALPAHYAVLRAGHLKVHYLESPTLRRCIEERNTPERQFAGLLSQHADEACVIFRALLGEHVERSADGAKARLQDMKLTSRYPEGITIWKVLAFRFKIDSYPSGGGSYNVASFLGERLGLFIASLQF